MEDIKPKLDNVLSDWKKAVFAFCGIKATESISSYLDRGFYLGKTAFSGSRIMEFMSTRTLRNKTAQLVEFKPLASIDVEELKNLHNYAKAGNIDSLHAFLIVQHSTYLHTGVYMIGTEELIDTGIQYDETILMDILQAGNRGKNDQLNIDKIPALLVIVAEENVKMAKYKELGYEYCLLEAGMMLQNLYVGVRKSLAVRPMGSYDKERTLRRLELSPKKFTPMITALIGTK